MAISRDPLKLKFDTPMPVEDWMIYVFILLRRSPMAVSNDLELEKYCWVVNERD